MFVHWISFCLDHDKQREKDHSSDRARDVDSGHLEDILLCIILCFLIFILSISVIKEFFVFNVKNEKPNNFILSLCQAFLYVEIKKNPFVGSQFCYSGSSRASFKWQTEKRN